MKEKHLSHHTANKKDTALWAGLSFVLPAAVISVILAVCGITPFGSATLITEGSVEWFENFCRLYEAIISGKSVFYHLNVGFGRSFYAEFAEGLCSPFLFVALFFPSGGLAAAYSVITILRAGFSGLFAWHMLDKSTRADRPLCFALACGYALGGFTACAAYYPSLADAAVFFPLVVTGIFVYVTERRPVKMFLFTTLFFFTCSRLFIGGIAMCFLLYFAFLYRENRTKKGYVSLYPFAMFSATLLCAIAAAAWLILPAGAAAVDYQDGIFSRVESADLLASLCFGGYGTNAAAGEWYLCLAGFLLIGLLAFLLNRAIGLYERVFIGAGAALVLLSSALPPMGRILFGFCAYTDEKVNMGFVLATLAVYATARNFAAPDGIRLRTTAIAAGGYLLLGGASLLLNGAGAFAILAEAGLAVALTAVFVMLSYDKKPASVKSAVLTVCLLVLFGGIHCGAAVSGIASPYRSDELAAETTERLHINQLITENEVANGRSMRFFRYRSVDSANADGANLSRNESADLEAFAERLGILPQSPCGGGENFTPLTDILFGVGYMIENGEARALDDSVQSPAYLVSDGDAAALGEGNAFEVQNALAARWFGVENLFTPAAAELRESTNSAENERYRWTFNNETTLVNQYAVKLNVGDSLYLLAEGGNYAYAVSSDSRSDWRTGCAGGIYPLCENAAYFDHGEMIVYLSTDETEGIPAPTFMLVSEEARQTLTEHAAARGAEYISHRGSTVNFMLTADDAQTTVTSIPYEYGWTITDNGQKIQAEEIEGLIGIRLESGTHSIVMRYAPPFLKGSLIVSCVTFVMGMYITLYTEHEIVRRRKVRMAFRAVEKNRAKGKHN